jgi:sodium-independent sulfate anion transporter 11
MARNDAIHRFHFFPYIMRFPTRAYLKWRIRQGWYDSLPILSWLPNYNRSWLLADLIAGFTIGVMVVPQAIADAKIAGLPVAYGLYTSFIGVLIYPFFGTSKDITVGPTAVLSLLTGQLVARVEPSIPATTAAVTTTFIAGIFSLVLNAFKLGFILDFFSAPVVMGFTTGAALTIFIQQIPKTIGIPNVNTKEAAYLVIYNLFKNFKQISLSDMAVGLSCFAVLLALKLAKTKWPNMHSVYRTLCSARNAVVAVLVTLLSFLINRNRATPAFKITKDVPAGLPVPRAPDLSLNVLSTIIVSALVLSLISVLESIAIGRSLGRKNGYRIRTNQELLALGTANLVGSFFSSYPTTGSFSRSAVNSESGVKTPLGGLVTSAIVICALLFLTPAFYYIPDACLGAIIQVSILALMYPPSEFLRIYRSEKLEFLAAIIALIVTLFTSVEIGLASAIGFSLFVFLYRMARPRMYRLLPVAGDDSIYLREDKVEHPRDIPGVFVFRIQESMVFPNAGYVQDRIIATVFANTVRKGPTVSKGEQMWNQSIHHRSKPRTPPYRIQSSATPSPAVFADPQELEQQAPLPDKELPPLKGIVLDFHGVNRIDVTGTTLLTELRQAMVNHAGTNHFKLALVGVNRSVLKFLHRSGYVQTITNGQEWDESRYQELYAQHIVFDDIPSAVEAIQSGFHAQSMLIESDNIVN